MKKFLLPFMVLTLPIGAGGLWFYTPQPPSPFAYPPASTTAPLATPLHSGSKHAPTATTTQPLSDVEWQARLRNTSLNNTRPPAIPNVDERGNLVINRELRDIFDYFFSLQGELEETDIQRLISGFMALHLSPAATQEAMQVLQQYQILQARLKEAATNAAPEDLQVHLQQLMAIRREILGDALADAFFGEEEAYDQYSLQKMAYLTKEKTNADHISAWEDNALADLPASLQHRQQERIKQQRLLEGTQRLKQKGASAADIYQFQLLNGDTEVAERYQQLTLQRQQWQERLAHFRQQRDAINQHVIDAGEKAARLQQLLADSFNETERLRVHTLERMEQSASATVY